MSHYNEQREADEIWKNAPSTATHYGDGKFWRMHDSGNCWETECTFQWVFSNESPSTFNDYQERPQQKPKYEYGVEHPTNGQKPDLPGDVDIRIIWEDGARTEGPLKETNLGWIATKSFSVIDERYKPAETAHDALKPRNPYQRTIIGLDGSKCVVDVYRVLDAFKTDSTALDHAVKKILCPGTRHAKTREQDLKEAIKSIEAELLLMEQRNG